MCKFPGEERGNCKCFFGLITPCPVTVNEFCLGGVVPFEGINMGDFSIIFCVVPIVGSFWPVNVLCLVKRFRVGYYVASTREILFIDRSCESEVVYEFDFFSICMCVDCSRVKYVNVSSRFLEVCKWWSFVNSG